MQLITGETDTLGGGSDRYPIGGGGQVTDTNGARPLVSVFDSGLDAT